VILHIDHTSEEPLYMQIRSQVIASIACGDLKPLDGLPSVRALASDLGVNLHTVNKAYAVLRDEGYLLIRGRSGAYVADPENPSSPLHAVLAGEHLQSSLRALVQEHKAAGGDEDSFLAETARQVRAVYEDPGIAGARRDVHVLGIESSDTAEGSDAVYSTAHRTHQQGGLI